MIKNRWEGLKTSVINRIRVFGDKGVVVVIRRMLFVMSLSALSVAQAATIGWNGGSGAWETGANWSGGVTPTLADLVGVNPDGSIVHVSTAGNEAGDFRMSDGSGDVTLNIDYAGPGTAITFGPLTVGRRNGGLSTINHTNGYVLSGNVQIGGNVADGIYNISGGTLEIDNTLLSVATTGGNGEMNISGTGTVLVDRHFSLGTGTGTGTLTISENGTFRSTFGGGWRSGIGDNGTMHIMGTGATVRMEHQFLMTTGAVLRFTLGDSINGASTITSTGSKRSSSQK